MEEENAKVSDSTVWHYACRPKKELGIGKERFLDLVRAPGEARADFGEANFYVMGVRRLSNFVLTFPFSNVGLAQVFPGENAECVWQALKDIFEFIGGVPACIVFDNAAGVGRRVGDKVRAAGLFAAHYRFAFSFCNPNAGHEKGSVENKVGFIRRNLFVPVPSFDTGRRFNKSLLDRCMALSEKDHWARGEEERALFIEDKVALIGLPLASLRRGVLRGPQDRQARPRAAGVEPHLLGGAGAGADGGRLRPARAGGVHRRRGGSRAPTGAFPPAPAIQRTSWPCSPGSPARGATAR